MAATAVGAMVGAVAGYLFFTPGGRSLRRQIEPALLDIAREVHGFREVVAETASLASAGWDGLGRRLG